MLLVSKTLDKLFTKYANVLFQGNFDACVVNDNLRMSYKSYCVNHPVSKISRSLVLMILFQQVDLHPSKVRVVENFTE